MALSHHGLWPIIQDIEEYEVNLCQIKSFRLQTTEEERCLPWFGKGVTKNNKILTTVAIRKFMHKTLIIHRMFVSSKNEAQLRIDLITIIQHKNKSLFIFLNLSQRDIFLFNKRMQTWTGII